VANLALQLPEDCAAVGLLSYFTVAYAVLVHEFNK